MEVDQLYYIDQPQKMAHFEKCADQIIAAGKTLYQQGLVPATSGNFSARLEDGNIAITVSGKHKGKLTREDIMIIDSQGNPLEGKKPSAETGLHVQIYQHFTNVGAILHPHSLNAVLISRVCQQMVSLHNYELLKAFAGINSHEVTVNVPIFPNNQDIPTLMRQVADYLAKQEPIYAYIIAGHGFYTWGKTMEDTLRHVEALDYLLACELSQL